MDEISDMPFEVQLKYAFFGAIAIFVIFYGGGMLMNAIQDVFWKIKGLKRKK